MGVLTIRMPEALQCENLEMQNTRSEIYAPRSQGYAPNKVQNSQAPPAAFAPALAAPEPNRPRRRSCLPTHGNRTVSFPLLAANLPWLSSPYGARYPTWHSILQRSVVHDASQPSRSSSSMKIQTFAKLIESSETAVALGAIWLIHLCL